MPETDPTTAELFMDAVLRTVGEAGLAKLRAVAGGTAITLPIFPAESSVIARALGMEDARKICAEMRVLDNEGRPVGFPPFYLPKGRDSATASRRQRVAELHAAGLSGNAIAVELGVAERTVRKHLRELRAGGEISRALPSTSSAGETRS